MLRKWLAEPGRLAAFAIHVAQRTAARKGKTQGTPGALLDATRALLPTVYGEGKVHPNPDRAARPPCMANSCMFVLAAYEGYHG